MYSIDDTQDLWDEHLQKINIMITNKALEFGIEKDLMDKQFKLFDI